MMTLPQRKGLLLTRAGKVLHFRRILWPMIRDVDRWLGKAISDCPCGRVHEIPLRIARIGRGVVDDVAAVVREAAGPTSDGACVLLADPDTWDAAGSTVAARLRAEGIEPFELLTGPEPHADDRTIEELDARLPHGAVSCILAVGSGTINDLGKVLAEITGAPQVTVATAASMNGYTSTIAALTVRGLKITRPAPSPVALLADTNVLAGAPPRMTAAGFGDLMSKPVSGADWVLSGELLGETVCPTALAVADDAVRRVRKRAAAIGAGAPEALDVLAEGLVLSGFSMVLAGASSPASGGEHLLSHYLDISADGWQRAPRLHGEQVAVGTLVSLALYEFLRAAGPPHGLAPPEATDDELRQWHAHLPAQALEELLAEHRQKVARQPDRRARREILATRWESLWTKLDRQLAMGRDLEADLRLAGAPTGFADIEVSAGRARELVRLARHMRQRYTVLDLAADLGHLDPFARTLST